ncbi:MAG: Rab family GTPase [Promethearchaeota archaeon]
MSTETKNPLLLRISILGEEGIGKDTFINTFTSNQFLKESDTGLGVAFYKGSIILDTEMGQQECIIWIWDLKEREGYIALHSRYLKGTNGIMLFFDLTNRQSFSKLINWVDNIQKNIGSEIPILLVGNREDSKKFVVSPNEINNFIREFNLFYIETSLAIKEGIYDSFYCITSLTLGVEIDHELFLSKDVIYYPSSSFIAKVPSPSILTSKDISILSQKAIFKRIESLEKTIDISLNIEVPLKMLITEVLLSILVVILFITSHFLHELDFPEFCFPFEEFFCLSKGNVIALTFCIAFAMEIVVLAPIIVGYIRTPKE